MFYSAIYLFLYSLLAAILSNAAPLELDARAGPPPNTVIDWDFQEQPLLTGLIETDRKPLVSFSGIWKVNPVDDKTQVPDHILNGMAKHAYELMVNRFRLYKDQGKLGSRLTAPTAVSVAQLGDFLYFASSVWGEKAQYDTAFPEPAETRIKTKHLLSDGRHAEPNYVRLWQEHNGNAKWHDSPKPKTSAWGHSPRNNQPEFFPPCSHGGANGNCKTFLKQLDPEVKSVTNRQAAEWNEARRWLGDRQPNKRWGPGSDESCGGGDDGGDDGGSKPGNNSDKKRPPSSSPPGKNDRKKKPANQARAAPPASPAKAKACTKKQPASKSAPSKTSAAKPSKTSSTKASGKPAPAKTTGKHAATQSPAKSPTQKQKPGKATGAPKSDPPKKNDLPKTGPAKKKTG